MKRILLLSAAVVCSTLQVFAQEYSSLWQLAKTPVATQGEQILHPTKFVVFQAVEQNLSAFLSGISTDANTPAIIDLPTPEGKYRSFRIWQTPAMAKELAAKYPGIVTLTAEDVYNKTVTAKIDYTQFGFHAMVFDGKNTFFIDPYSNVADGNYMSYYRNDYPLPAGKFMHCELEKKQPAVPGMEEMSLQEEERPRYAERLYGTTKRKYRLAVACTGEYAVAVNGPSPTKAGVLAKIVTSVNRVNGVYERELSYTLELIGNDDTLINLNGTTDPYNNLSGGAMLGQNQTTLTARVGLSAFDIGHVFSTGGGGIATLGCICDASSKAEGVTGLNNPVGDAFDIDYVAHEMGHQFGADHTFNNNTAGSCNGNAVSQQAYEPGSGSTLMAYAGICGGGNDYQGHSNDYFHSASLEQIAIYIGTTSCAVTSTSSNQNATLPAFTATYAIPYLTPFELIGPAATDATADQITYTWEERDRGDFGKAMVNTRLAGPLFRPFPPATNTTRIFPQIDSLLKNVFVSNAEKLADTNRKLAFRMVERDIFQGFGCWNFPTDSIRLNVIHTGQPFKVTSPGSTSVWSANGTASVTWNVGNTTAAPISCPNVDIFMSTDGGYTFPYTLATATANDGSEVVNVPNVNSSKMRIKVKGNGNVFLSISGANAIVEGGVGVGNINKEPEVLISPVPANDRIEINVKDANNYEARINNSIGQTVWQGHITGKANIEVSGWATGIYYLQLNNPANNIRMTRQIVVR